MSMHIVGPYLTTTSTKKRKNKVTKSQQDELERGWKERNQRLKEMHLPKETFEQYMEWVYGKGSKAKTKANNRSESSPTQKATQGSGVTKIHQVSVSEVQTGRNGSMEQNSEVGKKWITGPVSSKPSPVYTGTKMIGIGTMHKSNAVPIFSDDEAKDISSMRR